MKNGESKVFQLFQALFAIVKTIAIGWAIWASQTLIRIEKKIAVLEFRVFGTLAQEKTFTTGNAPSLGSVGLPIPLPLEKKDEKPKP